jgi:uncharacterized protein (TIGR02145 family)
MKKSFFKFSLLVALGLASIVFTSCQDNKQNTPANQTDSGVVINGVTWATRNVAAPGTFAANPEDPGMFYQWNRKTAWAATGEVTGWDSSNPTGTEWDAANDPSPAGYRVPTRAELESLLDKSKVRNEWTTHNGVTGRKFTDIATGNSVFFPAAGYRYSFDGALGGAGEYGSYWSSTEGVSSYAYSLSFVSSDASVYFGNRTGGRSVRCVAE